jgi:hypothetical protein
MSKQTLWERLTKGAPILELEIYNPLAAKVGTFLTLDLLEFRNKPPVRLNGFAEYTRDRHKFVDYLLDGDVRLRIIPSDDRKRPFDCYLLQLDTTEQWSEGLFESLHDPVGFKIDYGNGTVDTFTRVNKLKDPREAVVKELIDENNDKKIQDEEVKTYSLKYWDFYMEAKDEANQSFFKFLFIELDENKQFTFYQGKEIDPNRVMI